MLPRNPGDAERELVLAALEVLTSAGDDEVPEAEDGHTGSAPN